ncbi:MAG: aspartate-semialdehyde dehydrogenase [Gammaproteobacteria bacterium]|nr:aspartate-semialdehyde dehydrogenase [Gammaproteobacteria bacterium]
MSFCVAIVGATGLVGRALLTILEQRNFPIDHLILLASDRSAGQIVSFGLKNYTVLSLAEFDWKRRVVDIAFFSAGNEVSLHYAPIARDSGCVVIDNSSAFRYDDDIPLIVPEVNGGDLKLNKMQIIANPNCSTMQLVMVLAPIHALVGIKRVIISTYQAVSGAGQMLVDALKNGEQSDASIHHNVIPQIDVLQNNGYSREEMKMLWESRKILNNPSLLLSATAVRVPVINGHSESVVIETEKPFSVTQAIQCLNNKPGLIVLEDHWVTPKEVSGKDDVFVSRVRQDLAFGENGLSFWVVADNLRKGAALNAVQIAEFFVSKRFV